MTPDAAHAMTKAAKKEGFYFRTLTRTDIKGLVQCEVNAPGLDYIHTHAGMLDKPGYRYNLTFRTEDNACSRDLRTGLQDVMNIIVRENGTDTRQFKYYQGGKVGIYNIDRQDPIYSEEILPFR